MSRLFYFGIGGTGSRVLKSLAMLLTSGVEIPVDEIVPIIMDPDVTLPALTDTIQYLRKYNDVYTKIGGNGKGGFYRTKFNLDILPQCSMTIKGTSNKIFKDYIDFNSMSDENKALASMLFSSNNLKSEMDVGFKGNPNIGSVVLNQLKDSEEFKTIVNNFSQGDRIFVATSIFGGTGASGFPLLVKIIRTLSSESNINNWNIVKSAPIGAITVLPYFQIKEDKKSEIDSSTFVMKTKSALRYYEKNLKEPNVLYYIGDNQVNALYENHEGGVDQDNMANFIELVSALAVVDFVKIPNSDACFKFDSQNNVLAPKFKEYGGQDSLSGKSDVVFSDLSDQTNNIIKKSLMQYVLFGFFVREKMKKSSEEVWAKELGYDKTFFDGDFYKNVESNVNFFWKWMKEMKGNSRSFAPFNLDVNCNSHLFEFVKGIDARSKLFGINRNFDLFNATLNKLYKNMKSPGAKNKEELLLNLFYNATEQLVNKKFNI